MTELGCKEEKMAKEDSLLQMETTMREITEITRRTAMVAYNLSQAQNSMENGTTTVLMGME